MDLAERSARLNASTELMSGFGVPRMTRGQCGSLLLHCNGLSPSTSCRSSRRTVAQWLACALPYRRFVDVLTNGNARLGADADRYSFIVSDFHRLLLAGLPAHFESDMPSQTVRSLRHRRQHPQTTGMNGGMPDGGRGK